MNEVAGYDLQVVAAHMEMLHDAGFIEVKFVRSTSLAAIKLKTIFAGHDLLNTIRCDSSWNKIKNVAKGKVVRINPRSR